MSRKCFSGCETVRVQFAESQTAYEEKSPILNKIQLFSLIPPGRRAAITRVGSRSGRGPGRSPKYYEKTSQIDFSLRSFRRKRSKDRKQKFAMFFAIRRNFEIAAYPPPKTKMVSDGILLLLLLRTLRTAACLLLLLSDACCLLCIRTHCCCCAKPATQICEVFDFRRTSSTFRTLRSFWLFSCRWILLSPRTTHSQQHSAAAAATSSTQQQQAAAVVVSSDHTVQYVVPVRRTTYCWLLCTHVVHVLALRAVVVRRTSYAYDVLLYTGIIYQYIYTNEITNYTEQ